ncbi:hypothetical protein JCM12141A_05380 [Mycolicibacterium hodleri]
MFSPTSCARSARKDLARVEATVGVVSDHAQWVLPPIIVGDAAHNVQGVGPRMGPFYDLFGLAADLGRRAAKLVT